MHSEWKHGQVIRSEKLAGHRFVETVYNPQIELLPHSHDFVYFCFVVEGDFVESYGRDENLYGQSADPFPFSSPKAKLDFFIEILNRNISFQKMKTGRSKASK